MTQNRNLTGAAEAIEKTKNGDFGNSLQGAYDTATESARNTYEGAVETISQASHDAYDYVGDTLRAGEDYARRKPMHALAAVAAVGLVLGYVFAVRSAPRSSLRNRFSHWR
jgi:ElaB/YqjD/DUF883 family membrane-anchored ribosome-binding protein